MNEMNENAQISSEFETDREPA